MTRNSTRLVKKHAWHRLRSASTLYPSFSEGSMASSSSSVNGLFLSHISFCSLMSWYCSGVKGT